MSMNLCLLQGQANGPYYGMSWGKQYYWAHQHIPTTIIWWEMADEVNSWSLSVDGRHFYMKGGSGRVPLPFTMTRAEVLGGSSNAKKPLPMVREVFRLDS